MVTIQDGGGLENPNRASVVGGGLKITTASPEAGGFPGSIVITPELQEHGHFGELFSTGAYDLSLGAGANLDILFRTGAHEAHMQASGQASQSVLAQMFEDITVSADGTPLGISPRNRIIIKTPLSTAFLTPTITVLGTPVFDGYIEGGTGGQASGGSLAGFSEWILKPNTNYLARIANTVTGGAAQAQIQLNFYEPGVV